MTLRASMHAACVLCITCACLLLAQSAAAKVERYALIVGNNVGLSAELPLRYAQRDADKLEGVLRSLGDFDPLNVVSLLGEDASSFERALIRINARIRSEQRAGSEVMLLVFYSGHADAHALHLGNSRLPIDRLRYLVQGSPADFRVLLLDACNSGSLTRVKGGKRIPGFDISVDRALAGEGIAFLTSSAAGEDAQESEELKGSFFSHYLISGLRGAGDKNADGMVSVDEAYRYAYHHTVRASSETRHGVQHPTFHLDLRGKGAVPLTWVARNTANKARLRFPAGRTYLVFAGSSSGDVVAEVNEQDKRRTLTLAPGKYLVRGRGEDHLLEGVVTALGGQTRRVEDQQLERVEYARLARKGGTHGTLSHGPFVGFQIRSPFWSGASACMGPRGGYELALEPFTAQARLGYCSSSFDNTHLATEAEELDTDVAILKVLDLGRFSVGAGAGIGAAWLRQTFSGSRIAPARNTVALELAALAQLGFEADAGLFLGLEVAGYAHLFRQQSGQPPRTDTTTEFTLRANLHAGKRF